jgi:Domain of unknown function (DUF4383)
MNRIRPEKGATMEGQRTPAQWFALLAGAFLIALGVLTLVLNGLDFGATSSPEEFLLWKASGWNTVLWMAIGAAGVLASMRVDASRGFGLVAAAVFGILALWGFVDGGVETMGVFAIGTAGNITHAIIAALGFAVATAPEPARRQTTADDRPYGQTTL